MSNNDCIVECQPSTKVQGSGQDGNLPNLGFRADSGRVSWIRMPVLLYERLPRKGEKGFFSIKFQVALAIHAGLEVAERRITWDEPEGTAPPSAPHRESMRIQRKKIETLGGIG
jgi:hypothetical protein